MPHNPYRDYGCARTFLNRPRRWRSSASDYGACCSEARFGQGSARAHWAKPSCVNASLSRRHSVQCYCLTSNAVATDEHHSYIINKGLSRWESNVGQANHRNYKSGRRGSNPRRPAWEAGSHSMRPHLVSSMRNHNIRPQTSHLRFIDWRF